MGLRTVEGPHREKVHAVHRAPERLEHLLAQLEVSTLELIQSREAGLQRLAVYGLCHGLVRLTPSIRNEIFPATQRARSG